MKTLIYTIIAAGVGYGAVYAFVYLFPAMPFLYVR